MTAAGLARYRSYRTAAASGVRAAAWFAIASMFYIWAGWPAASVSLSFVALIVGFGTITPKSAQPHRSRACWCADRNCPDRHTRVHHPQWRRRLSPAGHRSCSLYDRRSTPHNLLKSSVVITWPRQSAFHHDDPGAEQSADLQSAGLSLHLSIHHRGSDAPARGKDANSPVTDDKRRMRLLAEARSEVHERLHPKEELRRR